MFLDVLIFKPRDRNTILGTPSQHWCLHKGQHTCSQRGEVQLQSNSCSFSLWDAMSHTNPHDVINSVAREGQENSSQWFSTLACVACHMCHSDAKQKDNQYVQFATVSNCLRINHCNNNLSIHTTISKECFDGHFYGWVLPEMQPGSTQMLSPELSVWNEVLSQQDSLLLPSAL